MAHVGYRAWGLGKGLRCRPLSFWFRVSGLGFRAQDFELRIY